MAHAEVKDLTTTKMVEVTETARTVTLKLTPEEAVVLVAILAKVGGSPDTSPRKYVDDVFKALHRDGGVPWIRDEDLQNPSYSKGIGNIYFHDSTVAVVERAAAKLEVTQ